ncbi:hypothetical protein SteCoe_36622 [Stentor coeruleus]|uniref:Uncharacterized protein n=1 Tax=Stentor coeruleus TaxID=5963 RepID=A0A1R2APY7_9CILI|nr:hypothetical protein SteCoe_36622 [Stentor coeruleus]
MACFLAYLLLFVKLVAVFFLIIFSNTSLIKCLDFPDYRSSPVFCESAGGKIELGISNFIWADLYRYIVVGKSAKRGLLTVNDEANYFKPIGVVSSDNDRDDSNVWDA